MNDFRIFIPEDYFDSWERVQSVFNRLEKLYNLLFQNKKYLSCNVFIDLEALQDYLELEIYEAKSILSLLLDTSTIFKEVKNVSETKNYKYFKVNAPSIHCFQETLCRSHIYAFETSIGSTVTQMLSHDLQITSLIRTHRLPMLSPPRLNNFNGIYLNNTFLHVFLEQFLKPEFKQELAAFEAFKIQYLNFYNSYNWAIWDPISDTAPAHQFLGALAHVHRMDKSDVYLLRWGYIMATLNGAHLNAQLTQLNSRQKNVNDVFQVGLNKGRHTVFFSTDTEQGNLEIYDHLGRHQNLIYGIETGIVSQPRKYTIEVPRDKWLT